MKNNGGPAFPAQEYNADLSNGMTLRDYFAAKAMQTLVTTWADSDPRHAEKMAEAAYQFADAMLAERDKP